jgi:hypothetical protein
MKKFILIFAIAIFALGAFGQNPTKKVLANYVKLDADTVTYSTTLSEKYSSNFFITWTHNADSVGFVMQQGPDNVNWTDLIYYINGTAVDTVFYDTTDGTVSFMDPIGVAAEYIRLKVFATDTVRVTITRTLRRN